MNTVKMSLPEGRESQERLVQAELGVNLLSAIKKEVKRRGLKLRDAVEWGLKRFLLESNPEAAKKLGITGEK